jgi:FkbM family methyltransferase
LRGMQPFTFHQGRVDNQLVNTLQEAARAIAQVDNQLVNTLQETARAIAALQHHAAQQQERLDKLDARSSQQLNKLNRRVSEQFSELDTRVSQQLGELDMKISQIMGGMELGSVPLKETHYLGFPFVYPYDSEIGELINSGEEWDAVIRPIVMELLPEDEPMICEVGSNIGASLFQMLAAKPRARVVAVEPSDRFLPFLYRNLELTGFDRVEVLPVLLGKESGSMLLHNNSTSASVVSAEYDEHEPRTRQLAEMTTLDKVFRDRDRVDFIKTDTDGFDFEVLRGAEATIRRDLPVLYFEVEPHLLSNPAEDLAWLQDLGYRRLVCIMPQGKTEGKVLLHGITEDPEQIIAWANERGLCDVLACPEGSTYEARLKRIEFARPEVEP